MWLRNVLIREVLTPTRDVKRGAKRDATVDTSAKWRIKVEVIDTGKLTLHEYHHRRSRVLTPRRRG
jgi:hypothetical protein